MWKKPLVRRLVVRSGLQAAMMLALGAAPAQSQGEIGNVCVARFEPGANCSANDVDTGELVIRTVLESCAQGVPDEAEVVFDVVMTSGSPDRYGIGVFLALDGNDAKTGNRCLHDFFSPRYPTDDPSAWPKDPFGRFVAPFPNLNGDACGDIPGKSSMVKTLQPVRIACRDSNGDGFVDVSACASWENNRSASCGGLPDAIPGTSAQCGCRTLTTSLRMPARISVVKQTTASDGTFAFASSLPAGTFTITTSGGTGRAGPVVVDSGKYSITEVPPEGWRLDSATCSNGSRPDELTLSPGDNVVCTFTDSPISRAPSSITIVKQAQGGDGTFAFTGNGQPFTIATASGTGRTTFSNVSAGAYDATESVPAGWRLERITCSDGSPTDASTATAHIDLAAGEAVTCTFVNRVNLEIPTPAPAPIPPVPLPAPIPPAPLPAPTPQEPVPLPAPGPSTITIVKTALDGDGTFAFTGNGQAFTIATTSGTGRRTFSNLSAGAYDATESVPAGWRLESITCSDGSPTDTSTATAHIDLAAGEAVTCTFVNRSNAPTPLPAPSPPPPSPPAPGPSSITIVKTALDGDGTFAFNGNGQPFTIVTSGGTGRRVFSNVPAGRYDATESVPAGWRLESIMCTDGSPVAISTATAQIELAAGEEVTCTFVNRRAMPVPALPGISAVILMALLVATAAWRLRRAAPRLG